jgi:Zn-finger nucleic acid-binding protein
MARCSNCNGPLPAGSIVCGYCGSRNDVDLKGIHYYTTHESDTPRTCPRCSVSLKTVDLKVNGRFLIDRCDQCLGLFFDPGELEALLEATVSNVFGIDRSGLAAVNAERSTDRYGISYIKCPHCAKLMNRVNFGVRSGVIVDRCKEHGVWLDGGELRQLFEWMKLGGRLLEQERQQQQKKEEVRQERERRDRSAGATEPSPFDDYSETLRMSDPDLFGIVAKAIRFFLR